VRPKSCWPIVWSWCFVAAFRRHPLTGAPFHADDLSGGRLDLNSARLAAPPMVLVLVIGGTSRLPLHLRKNPPPSLYGRPPGCWRQLVLSSSPGPWACSARFAEILRSIVPRAAADRPHRCASPPAAFTVGIIVFIITRSCCPNDWPAAAKPGASHRVLLALTAATLNLVNELFWQEVRPSVRAAMAGRYRLPCGSRYGQAGAAVLRGALIYFLGSALRAYVATIGFIPAIVRVHLRVHACRLQGAGGHAGRL